MAHPNGISASPTDLTTSSINTPAGEEDINDAINIDPDTVDYWTALLRKNLSTIQALGNINGDGEDGPQVDEEVMNAPRRNSPRDSLAIELAARLYPAPPDSLAPIIKYEKDIVMLRSRVLYQRRSAIARASERNAQHNWIKLVSRQGPWDEVNDPVALSGASSLPMPVDQSDKESLAPFFAHLALDGTHEPNSTPVGSTNGVSGFEPYHETDLIEFEKGVLYADGRVDLCKMVTGPRNIGDLMESLKSNTSSKHFLLGNNITGPCGAKEISRFLDKYPDKFETWYLAGNCLDRPSFTLLVDSMIKSTAITNVWLKRNPLGVDAVRDVYKLITETHHLRTLDLDQTELSDAGIAQLFNLLAAHVSSEALALRHIYLNACGLGGKACSEIARYLQSPRCTLESLYMSNNPIGNAASSLAIGVKANRTLKRVILQSCGLKDEGVVALAEALKHHVSITIFDIGQSYATEDLGMRYNWTTEKSVEALADLVTNSNLQYLDISYTPASQSSVNKLLRAATTSKSLVWFHLKPLFTGARDAVSVKVGQEYARLYKMTRDRLHENAKEQYGVDYVRFENEHKRYLVSPTDIRFIDSVYRNRDARAARLGLKKLEKWWSVDDDTLKRVQDGTLGFDT